MSALPTDAGLDLRVIDALQDGIPVVSRPFEALAGRLGIDEATLVERIQAMLRDGRLSRFGPMYDANALGGAFTLAALSVPEARFDDVAAIVNAHAEVAHNYRRDHRYNMWFVVGTETPERIDAVLAQIGGQTGLTPLDLPKLDEYFLRLRLPLAEGA
jgi:DNA-binding Lrp family transcriptional regulator